MLSSNNMLIGSIDVIPPPSCTINDPPPSAVTTANGSGLPAVQTIAVQFTNDEPIDDTSPFGCFASFGQVGNAFEWLYHGGGLSGAMTNETFAFFKTDTSYNLGHTYIREPVAEGTHTLVMVSSVSGEAAWIDGLPVTVYLASGSVRTDYAANNTRLSVGARALDGSSTPSYDSYTQHDVHRAIASNRQWVQEDVDSFISGGTPADSFDPGCPIS